MEATTNNSMDKYFTKKDLKKLIIPLLIEQTLAILVGLLDTVFISRYGDDLISGVSLSDMINTLLINIFSALATGGAVVVSQALGRKAIKDAKMSSNQLLLISLIVGLSIMLLTLLLGDSILKLLYGQISPTVMSAASTYLKLTCISFPFLALYNSAAALYRSLGNSKISMFVSLLMNIINVVGNSILIYGFNMGVEGVAIPTIVSRAVACLVILALLFKPSCPLRISFKEIFVPKIKTMGSILRFGIPSAVENGLFQLGRILVVSIIALYATYQTAANSTAGTFDSLGCIPGSAMNLAMITVVGQCIGAKDYKAARYFTKKLLKIAYIMTIVLNVGICSTIFLTVNIFNISPEAKELTIWLVLIHDGFAMLLWPAAFTLPNALRASNDVMFTMVVSVFSMFVFRLGFSYVFHYTLHLGALGVWTAMIFDWTFKALVFIIRYKVRKLEPKKSILKTA